MQRLRVAVDMDEVIADTYGGMVDWLARERGVVLSDDVRRGRQLVELTAPDDYAALQAVMRDGDFFGRLAPIDGAIAAMEALAARCEVFIASAAMEYPGSFGPKYDWLVRYLPFLDPMRFVFCGDKSIVHADVLIDDNERNLAKFAGQGVLFASPHNAGRDTYPRLERWSDAGALIDRLDSLRRR